MVIIRKGHIGFFPRRPPSQRLPYAPLFAQVLNSMDFLDFDLEERFDGMLNSDLAGIGAYFEHHLVTHSTDQGRLFRN